MEQGLEPQADGQAGQVELALPSTLAFEPVAVQLAGSVAAQMGFSTARREDVKTAVGEAFINAVEHGNRGRADRRVTLRFELAAEELRVEVADGGAGFDPDRAAVPHLQEKIAGRESRRGWGLFLMRRLVDHLEVHPQVPSGCCLSLTIRPEQSPLKE